MHWRPSSEILSPRLLGQAPPPTHTHTPTHEQFKRHQGSSQEQSPGKEGGHSQICLENTSPLPDPLKYPKVSITGSHYYSRGTGLQRVCVAKRLVPMPLYKWRTHPQLALLPCPRASQCQSPGSRAVQMWWRDRHFRKGKRPSLRTSPLHPRGWPARPIERPAGFWHPVWGLGGGRAHRAASADTWRRPGSQPTSGPALRGGCQRWVTGAENKAPPLGKAG